MGDRRDADWVPIAAGVAVGAGLLVLLYKVFFRKAPSKCGPAQACPGRPTQYYYTTCDCRTGPNSSAQKCPKSPSLTLSLKSNEKKCD